jgi:acetylornithine deacetylase/succinyl-diaminopimelate desuccinylase-like protein
MLFRRRGFPTYGFSPIPMNITDASRRHRSHERVYLPDFLAGVRLFRDILEEFALRPGG